MTACGSTNVTDIGRCASGADPTVGVFSHTYDDQGRVITISSYCSSWENGTCVQPDIVGRTQVTDHPNTGDPQTDMATKYISWNPDLGGQIYYMDENRNQVGAKPCAYEFVNFATGECLQ